MMKSSELFGKIPKWVFKVQHKLAIWRIAAAKQQLAVQVSRPLDDRNFYFEKKLHDAILFWEVLRDEAKEGMVGGA